MACLTRAVSNATGLQDEFDHFNQNRAMSFISLEVILHSPKNIERSA